MKPQVIVDQVGSDIAFIEELLREGDTDLSRTLATSGAAAGTSMTGHSLLQLDEEVRRADVLLKPRATMDGNRRSRALGMTLVMTGATFEGPPTRTQIDFD